MLYLGKWLYSIIRSADVVEKCRSRKKTDKASLSFSAFIDDMGAKEDQGKRKLESD